MNLGFLLSFRNPEQWHRPFTRLYNEYIEEAVLAEQLGYDSIWTTEHHFYDDGWSPSLLPILSAMAMRTSRIRLGTFIIILPLHNPIRVAEDAATVDILSNGRLDLGVGRGYVVSEFEGFGLPRSERSSRLIEGVEIIKRCFTEENFDYAGKHYKLSKVNLTPKPVQKPHPPIWVGAMAEKPVERAAQLGCHLAGTGSPELQVFYDDALRRRGQDPKQFHISQLRAVYVARTREQAWDEVEPFLHYTMTAYERRYSQAKDLEASGPLFAEHIPPPGQMRHAKDLKFFQAPCAIGSPEDVFNDLQRYRRETRVTHLVMWMHLPGMDTQNVRRSMDLFAKEVMPSLRTTA